MNTIGAVSLASNAIQRDSQRLEKTAQRTASDDETATSPQTAAAQVAIRSSVEANSAVVKAVDETTSNLLDIVG